MTTDSGATKSFTVQHCSRAAVQMGPASTAQSSARRADAEVQQVAVQEHRRARHWSWLGGEAMKSQAISAADHRIMLQYLIVEAAQFQVRHRRRQESSSSGCGAMSYCSSFEFPLTPQSYRELAEDIDTIMSRHPQKDHFEHVLTQLHRLRLFHADHTPAAL